jgi:hypothetical protein
MQQKQIEESLTFEEILDSRFSKTKPDAYQR